MPSDRRTEDPVGGRTRPASPGRLEVDLAPGVLRWARERARLTDAELARRTGASIAAVNEWERTGRLRVRQVERLANATHTPSGFLYLDDPPEERLPIPDFRLVRGGHVQSASPDLIDVLDDTELRQDWYRDYVLANGGERLDFVGLLNLDVPVLAAARQIRERLRLDLSVRTNATTWEDALRLEVDRIEASGVLVMRNGVVGNNTSRPLDVTEFRGFAIADEFAPLIFINARDAKAAQLFTLMHELVHIWLGQSGISNLSTTLPAPSRIEQYSNQVAAELLVPSSELEEAWVERGGRTDSVAQLVRLFKVSSLVVLRRLFDLNKLDSATFQVLYAAEEERFLRSGTREDSGGDFYRTQTVRTSRRFATTLIAETLEGRASYRDAFRLLGIRSGATFSEFARRLGLVA